MINLKEDLIKIVDFELFLEKKVSFQTFATDRPTDPFFYV